ncbi:hypothetical protein CXB51_020357 [Gossypium anomalum]|uniref:RNase H type-1 domain-containing protein n=1 Tax=Gossypium anomalum TaxID=47600 RepID=A0A8J5YM19_9ROSI|nr:hypothetical protein CXB51_020357 [Gossypium anomalum]
MDQITRKVVVGGVIRNNKSNWEIGFNRNIGIASALEAELWAALDCLTIALERGQDKISPESRNREKENNQLYFCWVFRNWRRLIRAKGEKLIKYYPQDVKEKLGHEIKPTVDVGSGSSLINFNAIPGVRTEVSMEIVH